MFGFMPAGALPIPAACATDELVELMAAHARAESAHAQRKLAVVAELSRRREADDAAVGAWTSQLGEFVPAEVGVGLTVSKGVASAFVSTGQILDDRLPAIRAAFARGELDYARVRVIVERTAHVEDTSIAEVERRILDAALKPGRELVRGRLANAIDRIITALDPDGARERRKRAEADRDVQVRPDADGMCSLWGALTGVGGRALEERLREMAIGVCGSDPRTVSQRRADALTALALGIDHLACTCVDPGCPCIPEPPAKPRALIQVMIDAATLAGGADLPGVLGGLGIVDPELVRELAADASWQQLLTDTQGAVTGVGPTIAGGAVPACRSRPWRYSPSATLARLVRARDGQCRFPGCEVQARHCDLDHVQPFNHADPPAGGPTTAENLQSLCRWHHRLKTIGNRPVEALPGATMRWRSPTGTVHDTTPTGGMFRSHHDPDDPEAASVGDPPDAHGGRMVWEPSHPDPTGFDEPTSADIPDPWDNVDWRAIDDPMTTEEYERILADTRQRTEPPDPEAEPETHVVYACNCPPPF